MHVWMTVGCQYRQVNVHLMEYNDNKESVSTRTVVNDEVGIVLIDLWYEQEGPISFAWLLLIR